MLSADGLGCTTVTPFTSFTFWSLAEMAISAPACPAHSSAPISSAPAPRTCADTRMNAPNPNLILSVLQAFLAQVALQHRRVSHHLLRRAAADHLAVVEHHHMLGQRHHRAHHVLDEQDGEP